MDRYFKFLRRYQFWFWLILFIPSLSWLWTLWNYFPSIHLLPALGEITGILGMLLFAISLILSARYRWLESLIGNLNTLYSHHSKLGQWALILLAFHPFLLLVRYVSDWAGAKDFLFWGTNNAVRFGVVSLWFMWGLIILTLFLRPKYDVWKWTHKFLGFAFILGFLHVLAVPSATFAQNPFLKIYILLISGFAILSFLYRSILGSILVKRFRYTIKDVNKLNEEIIELVLSPEEDGFNYLPGQFVFLSIYQKGISRESHPFTLASTPEEKNLRIIIKDLGDYTKKLINNVDVGSVARVEGPYGDFVYLNSKGTQVWIAGGVGITPFIGFTKHILESNVKLFGDVYLYYSVKNADNAIYLDWFEEVDRKIENFHFIPHFSSKSGRITSDQILQEVSLDELSHVYICAPNRMVQDLSENFVKNGVPSEYIHSEGFIF